MDNWRIEQLTDLHKQDPDDEFVMFALAQEYFKSDEYDKALAFYLLLKKKNEDYVGLYYHLGALYTEMDQHAEALATYDEGIQIAQKLEDFHALGELKNAKTNLELGL